MIQKVSLRNFKAYRSLDLELEPFTVLVGPNASGKTTLLQGLQLVSGFAGEWLGEYSPVPVEQSGLLSYGLSALIEWSISGVWKGADGFVQVTVEPKAGAASVSGRWNGKSFPIRPTEGPSQIGKNLSMIEYKSLDKYPIDFRAALSSTTILHFEARKLAEASYGEAQIPGIGSNGNGLASVLAYLKLSQDEVFGEIEQSLRQVVPSVHRIRIERAPVEQTTIRNIALDEQRHQVPEKRTLWGDKVVFDMKGAKGVAADAVGEGTLMALGLLTVTLGPKTPRLILLDDIEMGLHPAAQGKLIGVLRRIQERDPELQIIATSHSPFILNYLDPKEVRMTFLAENGFARCEKLTAHPDFERWKDMMSPGEFWSTVGESWIEKTGQTASHE